MPRPNYSLARDNLQRPSTISETKRSSAPYRLRRLRGLINLYHWSLEWAIHADSDWTLGEKAYSFRLDRADLWLLGIDQVADLLKTNWGETAISAGAEKRDSPKLRGHFNPSELALNDEVLENAETITLDDAEREYTVKTHSWPSLIFDGRDLLTSVLFISPDLTRKRSADPCAPIPFEVISPAMRQASNHVEADMVSSEIVWDGPPYYLQFENGGQLLNYLKAKRIDGESALADLDQHRRSHCGLVEKALRVADERDFVLGKDDPIESCAIRTPKAVASAQLANETLSPRLDVQLHKRFRLAYLAFLYAQETTGRELKDNEAYAWIKEHEIDTEKSTKFGQLDSYKLPECATWVRYVRCARSAAGNNKNHPRAGRSGGSIAMYDQV